MGILWGLVFPQDGLIGSDQATGASRSSIWEVVLRRLVQNAGFQSRCMKLSLSPTAHDPQCKSYSCLPSPLPRWAQAQSGWVDFYRAAGAKLAPLEPVHAPARDQERLRSLAKQYIKTQTCSLVKASNLLRDEDVIDIARCAGRLPVPTALELFAECGAKSDGRGGYKPVKVATLTEKLEASLLTLKRTEEEKAVWRDWAAGLKEKHFRENPLKGRKPATTKLKYYEGILVPEAEKARLVAEQKKTPQQPAEDAKKKKKKAAKKKMARDSDDDPIGSSSAASSFGAAPSSAAPSGAAASSSGVVKSTAVASGSAPGMFASDSSGYPEEDEAFSRLVSAASEKDYGDDLGGGSAGQDGGGQMVFGGLWQEGGQTSGGESWQQGVSQQTSVGQQGGFGGASSSHGWPFGAQIFKRKSDEDAEEDGAGKRGRR